MIKNEKKILAFIGDGEGKTSAAIGHAIRAAGHNKKVAIIQFLKGQTRCGEYKFLKNFDCGIEIFLAGDPSFFIDQNKKSLHMQKAFEGVELAKKLILQNKYFLIILDEILDALYSKLINLSDLEHLIDLAKKSVNLIITGRILPPEISKKIDLLSQIKKVKHYYDLGEKGLEGLDW